MNTRADDRFHDEETGDELDRALEVAFQGESLFEATARAAIRSRILLREEGEGETPVVKTRSAEPPVGPAVDARYQVLGEIARGGVGVVFKGRDTALGRDVAMKVLQSRHASNAALVQRFVEEAQIAGQLQHPGVLPVYELGVQADRRPYFTMKLVKGRTLSALLQDRSNPADDRARLLGIFEQVCQTMAYAHTRGVIHRDLKPSNVMVGAFGEVQVVDWGLAKVLAHGTADERRPPGEAESDTVIETVRSGESSSHSVAGSVMGTPAYMSPEQARGEVEAIDERADVFALGAILCEILTGRPPFCGPDAVRDAAAGRLDEAIRRLDACAADEDLVRLARACLAPAAADRPRSARALVEAIGAHLSAVEERARATELAMTEARAKAAEERRARRLTVALAATITAAVLVLAAVFVWIERRGAERRATHTHLVTQAIEHARFLMGQAREARRGAAELWAGAAATVQKAETLAAAGPVEEDVHERVTALASDLAEAERDRRMVQHIEDLVVDGATHYDVESWLRMEERFEEAFREYGIDARRLEPDEIVRRLRESKITPDLTNGLELWLGTGFNLIQFGAGRHTPQELMAWIPLLYEADPDPFRTRVRQTFYTLAQEMADLALEAWRGDAALTGRQRAARDVARQAVIEMSDSPQFAEALPVTLSWLAITGAMAGDLELSDAIYSRAITLHPDDFLLNFDYSFYLSSQQRWVEAIGQYRACLAIRPAAAGIWRSLGMACSALAQHRQATSALRRSIELQGQHAPTHIDLAVVLAASGDAEGAMSACGEAARLRPRDPLAAARLGRLLHEAGRFEEALAQLTRARELAPGDASFKEPVDEWIEACRQAMESGKP